MYMPLPQFEQLLKDRQASALKSARSAGDQTRRRPAAGRGRPVRNPND